MDRVGERDLGTEFPRKPRWFVSRMGSEILTGEPVDIEAVSKFVTVTLFAKGGVGTCNPGKGLEDAGIRLIMGGSMG